MWKVIEQSHLTMEDILSSPAAVPLVAVGVLACASFALKVLKSTYDTFIRPGVNVKKLGKWAVVTGATDGIGKAYAQALAKKGMSVVLISRTEAKLQAVAKEIDDQNYPGVEKTKYVVCDYSNFDEKARKTVSTAISDLDIGILVNNVGVSYPYPKFFHELSEEQVGSLMEMNVASTTWMTLMVIKGMSERKRGCILNISSAAGMHTMPLLAQYSAAKGYIEKFSRALNAEYAGYKVTVQCQTPFYVASKLSKLRKSFTVPTPEAYAKLGLRWVGHGDPVVSPFWFHAVQGWVLECLPVFVVEKALMSMHMSIRKRGMKKEAAKAAKSS
mmetsp:Transcript_25733/g.38013  ORF Transcript_25733/g.38013 Transcript_25733/m.38013 type:complete len:329 (-) Transcript_25733:164-1150(-)